LDDLHISDRLKSGSDACTLAGRCTVLLKQIYQGHYSGMETEVMGTKEIQMELFKMETSWKVTLVGDKTITQRADLTW
jgi:hypothetical protein